MSDTELRPLEDVLVVDASRMLPGAVLVRMLVDLGARVIKIEHPLFGDPMRLAPPHVDGTGAGFCAFFRGVESVALDLKQPRGVDVMRALVRRASVFVESFRPGTLEAWGASPEQLMADNPSLVGCALSGFGTKGAEAAKVGHDLNIVAQSGLLSFLPGEGIPRVQLADVAAGMLACSSILAALLVRSRTGRGAWIDQPISRGPLPFLTFPMADLSAGGGGAADTFLSGACPAYRLFTCGDGGKIAVGALEPKFWKAFVDVVGLPELASRGLDTGASAGEVVSKVEAALAGHPCEHWLAEMAGKGLPVTPVLAPDQGLCELGAAGMTEHTRGPGGTAFQTLAPYLAVSNTPESRRAPRLGEHTDTVLAELQQRGQV